MKCLTENKLISLFIHFRSDLSILLRNSCESETSELDSTQVYNIEPHRHLIKHNGLGVLGEKINQ